MGRSWGPLGPSWRPRGPSWSPLGPSWGPLGGLLGPFGAILGASWAVLGRREAEKVETPKSLQNLRKSNEFCLLGPSRECSWRPLGASGGHLGRLGAILWHLGALLYHLGGLLGASWPFLGLSGGPRGRRPEGKPSLTRVCRDLLGSLPGYFSSGDPQGPPRAREVKYCKAVTGDLSTHLARWAGEFSECLSRLGAVFASSGENWNGRAVNAKRLESS